MAGPGEMWHRQSTQADIFHVGQKHRGLLEAAQLFYISVPLRNKCCSCHGEVSACQWATQSQSRDSQTMVKGFAIPVTLLQYQLFKEPWLSPRQGGHSCLSSLPFETVVDTKHLIPSRHCYLSCPVPVEVSPCLAVWLQSCLPTLQGASDAIPVSWVRDWAFYNPLPGCQCLSNAIK